MYWGFFYFQRMDFKITEFPELEFGTVYCIGRNYTLHIEEMKSKRTEDPVVFIKPRSSLIRNGENILLPGNIGEVHHEAELVLLIGKKASHVKTSEAGSYVKAFAAGIDVTARDLQSTAKKDGLPWALSKGFNTFAPIGNFVPYLKEKTDLSNLQLRLTVNGVVKQDDNTSNMIFTTDALISYLSSKFTLYPGDLIFTGTPSGVGKISSGDSVRVSLGNDDSVLEVNVVSE